MNWPGPARQRSKLTQPGAPGAQRVLGGPLLTRAGIIPVQENDGKVQLLANIQSKGLNRSSIFTHKGLFCAECNSGCGLPGGQTPPSLGEPSGGK